MAFTYPQKVLFKHCDPAGIVFYPRYFEMINDCVEAFFGEALDLPFHELMKTGGVPTVRIDTTFTAPSRHGDQLVLGLVVERLGRSSLDFRITGVTDGEDRFNCRATLVRTGPDGRPRPWQDDMRAKVTPYLGDLQ
jgi:4-hydroxybenzoyl-CoA thioesterase